MLNFGQETEQLEFKKTTGELREAAVDIAAILNKHGGGSLYFGILPNGDVKGFSVNESTLRDVSRVIFEAIKPQIYPEIKKVTLDGRDLIEVTFSGTDFPYSAFGRYYLRVADESREMTPGELRQKMMVKPLKSGWETVITNHGFDDIDEEMLERFYRRGRECGRLPDEPYEPGVLLEKLGLASDGRLNNAGYYLFGKNGPVVLKAAVFATDTKLTFLDINRFEDNIFRLIEIADNYIKKNIRWRAEINGLYRDEIPEIPVDALREVVVNSFVHADYCDLSQHEIDIHPGRVVIYNPGEFPRELSPEDFIAGSSSSILRNELIAKALYLCHDIEAFGSGFKRIYSACSDAGVTCSYRKNVYGFAFEFCRRLLWEDTEPIDVSEAPAGAYADFFGSQRSSQWVPLGKSIASNSRRREPGVAEMKATRKLPFGSTEYKVYELLQRQPAMTRSELSARTGKTVRTIQRVLNSLREKGLIKRIGADKNGYWEVQE